MHKKCIRNSRSQPRTAGKKPTEWSTHYRLHTTIVIHCVTVLYCFSSAFGARVFGARVSLSKKRFVNLLAPVLAGIRQMGAAGEAKGALSLARLLGPTGLKLPQYGPALTAAGGVADDRRWLCFLSHWQAAAGDQALRLSEALEARPAFWVGRSDYGCRLCAPSGPADRPVRADSLIRARCPLGSRGIRHAGTLGTAPAQAAVVRRRLGLH